MKKIILILVILGFSPLLAKADLIMPNTHSVERCAKIINLDKFPDVSLTGKITGPMISDEKNENYSIKNNECLSKGYKFNNLNIYLGAKLIYKDFESYGGYVENSNPLVKEIVEYSLAKTNDGNYILYKSKVTSEYNNGAPSKTETFPFQDDNLVNLSIKLNANGIRKTSSISDIKNLQTFLNSIQSNNLLHLKVDGKYGPKTTLAIKNFQTLNKLKSDGIFGKLSVAKAITILK